MQQQNKPHLLRGLNARHIRFIALGSAIGTGLFYGSASAIKAAGPAVLLAYLIGGAAVFIVMRALGEMAVRNPVSGSFSSYARQYLGPLAGFITGWTYTFEMVIVALADVTAFGIYMGLWYPDVPRWIWVLSIIFFIGAMNLCSVRVFGEMEFWLSLIKVVAIIAMIVAGGSIIFFGFGNAFPATGLDNLWSHGGFAPNGWEGIVASLGIVMFAFGGVEIIGVTAAEAKNPHKVIPQAINTIPLRIVLFYVCTLAILMAIFPWNSFGERGSPFVLIFDGLGIPAAATILNIIVISASISAINSDIFGAGRMMYGMAKEGLAPKSFQRIASNGVPWMTVVVMGVALLAILLALPRPAVKASKGKPLPFRAVLGRVWLYGMALALASAGFGVIATFITLFYDAKGWDGAAFALTLFSCTFVGTRLLFPNGINRLGGLNVAMICFSVEIVGLLLVGMASMPWMAKSGVLLAGAGFSLVFPALGVVAVKAVPQQNQGAALATYTVFMDLSLGVTGPLAGLVMTWAGVPVIYLAAAGLVAVALLLTWRLKKRPQVVSPEAESSS